MDKYDNLVSVLAKHFSTPSIANKQAIALIRENSETTITYKQLQQSISHAIHWLNVHNIQPHDRIILFIDDEIDFLVAFLACLYIGAIAVTCSPKLLKKNNEYLKLVSANTNAKCLICSPHNFTYSGDILPTFPFIRNLNQTAIDTPVFKPHTDTIAVLQYSSGSTGTPKGITVTHGNLTANIKTAINIYGEVCFERGCCWTPLSHDMGLIGGALLPIYLGSTAFIIPTEDFLKNPYLWLKTISEKKITFTFSPNFAFDTCVEKISDNLLKMLDLSSWSLAVNGGEQVKYETYINFTQKFASAGFHKKAFNPSYGLAESTMVSTGKHFDQELTTVNVSRAALEKQQVKRDLIDEQDKITLVGCGQVAAGHKLIIVEPNSKRKLDPYQVGEIWLCGDSVAYGYWNDTLATKETFQASIKNVKVNFLRTGDLGFLDDEQRLYIAGRIKEIIIVNGVNYYVDDIESTAEKANHLAVKHSTLLLLSDTGIMLLQEINDKSINYANLSASIYSTISKIHNVKLKRICFIQAGALPKTDLGKLRRLECKTLLATGTLSPHILFDSVEPAIPLDNNQPSNTLKVAGQYIHSWHTPEGKISPRILKLLLQDLLKQESIPKRSNKENNKPEITHTAYLAILSKLAEIDLGIACNAIIATTLGRGVYNSHASARLKESNIIKNDTLISFALTEAHPGSDLSQIKTTAKKQGDSWYLNGKKLWGGCLWADYAIIFAQTSDTEENKKYLNAFIVDLNSNNINRNHIQPCLGLHSLQQATIELNNVLVKKDFHIKVPFDSLKKIFSQSRLYISYLSDCAIRKALSSAKSYARTRIINQISLSNYPIARDAFKTAENTSAVINATCKTLAGLLDKGASLPNELFIALKIESTNWCKVIIDDLLNLFGAQGYLSSNKLLHLYQDVRAFSIIEGANDALANALGHSITTNTQDLFNFLETNTEASNILPEIKLLIERLSYCNSPDDLHYYVGKLASLKILKSILFLDNSISSEEQGYLTEWLDKLYEIRILTINVNHPSLVSRPKTEQLHPHMDPTNYSWMKGWLAQNLAVEESSITEQTDFFSLGMDSLTVARFSSDLTNYFKVMINSMSIWQYPTIQMLNTHIISMANNG